MREILSILIVILAALSLAAPVVASEHGEVIVGETSEAVDYGEADQALPETEPGPLRTGPMPGEGVVIDTDTANLNEPLGGVAAFSGEAIRAERKAV